MGARTQQRWADCCNSIDTLVERLRRYGPDVLHRAEAGGHKVPVPRSWNVELRAAGGISDPTGDAASVRTEKDPVLQDAMTAIAAVIRAEAALIDALGAIDHARNVGSAEDKQLQAPGSGECNACARYCPGGPDRLRGAYCDACRKAWERAGRPVERRAEWEHNRKQAADLDRREAKP